MRLTASQENYLEHILRLSRLGPVRVCDIALSVGVRLSSVTKAVGRLAEHGLVLHQSYGIVEITHMGQQAAKSVERRDNCLMRLLVEVLGMEPDQASHEVCRLEHVVSAEVLQRLECLVNKVTDVGSKRWLAGLQNQLSVIRPDNQQSGEVRVGELTPHADSNQHQRRGTSLNKKNGANPQNLSGGS